MPFARKEEKKEKEKRREREEKEDAFLLSLLMQWIFLTRSGTSLPETFKR